MAKRPNAMNLDDDTVDISPSTTTQPEPLDHAASRQGDQHRPYCRTHNVLMRAAKTASGITSYACPVPNCKATEKRAQPNSNIPREASWCPHCMAKAIAEEVAVPQPVYLEADYPRSTYAMLTMACPTRDCRFEMKIPRPDIAARSRVQARRTEQISER